MLMLPTATVLKKIPPLQWLKWFIHPILKPACCGAAEFHYE